VRGEVDVAAQRVRDLSGCVEVPLAVVDEQAHVGAQLLVGAHQAPDRRGVVEQPGVGRRQLEQAGQHRPVPQVLTTDGAGAGVTISAVPRDSPAVASPRTPSQRGRLPVTAVEIGREVRRRADVAWFCPGTRRPKVEPVMRSYVALLRGINVGAHNRVPMADVRSLMAGLGYEDVRTHLQSGNVIFRAPDAATADVERAIADRLEADLGLPVAVLVRTDDEFREVVAGNPVVGEDPARLMVLFLSEPLGHKLTEIDPARYDAGGLRPAPGRDLPVLRHRDPRVTAAEAVLRAAAGLRGDRPQLAHRHPDRRAA
jgi:hypothetical protein